MTELEELAEAVCEAPDDVRRILVYADRLQETGDPWGEALTLACDPAHQAEAGARRALLTAAPASPHVEAIDWRHGLVHRMSLTSGPRPWPQNPWNELIGHPACRFLVELTVRPRIDWSSKVELGDPDLPVIAGWELERIAQAIGRQPPRALRRLTLALEGPGPVAVDAMSMLLAPPRLEHLRLDDVVPPPGWQAEVPGLRSLRCERPGVPGSAAQAVGRSHWPDLELLSLNLAWVGDEAVELSALAELLAGQGLPRLRGLSFAGSGLGDDLVPLLLESPLVARLEVLELTDGDLSDAGALMLADAPPRLRHLRALRLAGNPIDHPDFLAPLGAMVRS